MPKFETETQKFRHRGWLDEETGQKVMAFGNDPEPVDSKGQPLKKLWDHDVEQVITVHDHVEAVAAPVEPPPAEPATPAPAELPPANPEATLPPPPELGDSGQQVS